MSVINIVPLLPAISFIGFTSHVFPKLKWSRAMIPLNFTHWKEETFRLDRRGNKCRRRGRIQDNCWTRGCFEQETTRRWQIEGENRCHTSGYTRRHSGTTVRLSIAFPCEYSFYRQTTPICNTELLYRNCCKIFDSRVENPYPVKNACIPMLFRSVI